MNRGNAFETQGDLKSALSDYQTALDLFDGPLNNHTQCRKRVKQDFAGYCLDDRQLRHIELLLERPDDDWSMVAAELEEIQLAAILQPPEEICLLLRHAVRAFGATPEGVKGNDAQ